jgi:hypothetical protein
MTVRPEPPRRALTGGGVHAPEVVEAVVVRREACDGQACQRGPGSTAIVTRTAHSEAPIVSGTGYDVDRGPAAPPSRKQRHRLYE